MANTISVHFSQWKQQVKEDFQVEHSKNDDNNNERVWSNQDLDPTPLEKRTWQWYNYLLYFIGTGFNNWTGGSSVIGIGLGWKAAIAIAFVASSISGIVQSLNSKAAARYHIGFPAIARTVYGMWGSSFQVVVRAILAAVWYATKIYEGASYLGVMMACVFGHHFTDIPNHVPKSVGYTTQDFLCYFLMWCITTPFIFRRPYQLRNFFTTSCVLSFVSILALFVYCMVLSGGKLGLGDSGLGAVQLSTSQTAWLVIYSLTSSISNGSTYIESVGDVARWSRTKWAVIPPTLFCNLFFNPLSAVLGIMGTSALQSATGQTLWKPWDVMQYMLAQHPGSSGVRFGVFLLAFTWMFQTMAQNVSSNMIPFGSDMSMLWPKHLTMTRGYVIVHLLAWVICPWKIYVSAGTFLDFLGAYGIFMGPAVSIMLCEYYIISNGNIFIPSIYIGNSANPNYWYSKGWNLRAYAAYIVSVGVCMVDFVNKVGATVPEAGVKLGYLGWFLTFNCGWVTYWAINKVWPHQNVKNVKELKWEEMADRYEDLSLTVVGLEVDGIGSDVGVQEVPDMKMDYKVDARQI